MKKYLVLLFVLMMGSVMITNTGCQSTPKKSAVSTVTSAPSSTTDVPASSKEVHVEVESDIMVEPPRTKAPPPPLVKEIEPVADKMLLDEIDEDAGELVEISDAVGMAKKAKVERQKSAGILTAGEINDFTKWVLWGDKTQENLRSYKSEWSIFPSKRYSVFVQNQDGLPVVAQKVSLVSGKKEVVWEAVTDNLGRAELWATLFDGNTQAKSQYSIQAKVNGETFLVEQATLFNDGVNHLKINKICDVSDVVDVAFVVDATGSMSDEISYLKTELNDVIGRVKEEHKDLSLRLGSVFYRDLGEDYVTRKTDLSSHISKTIGFIKKQSAAGGGDTPEAVEVALNEAVNHLSWTNGARAKILFLVLDAPPHSVKKVISKLNKTIAKAAAKGIRIVPVTGSGIDKSTEYLMRSLALATNGTYVFLTDHSGVGGSHIKPTTDSYNVEPLNDLLVRLFDEFTSVVSCDQALAMERCGNELDNLIGNHVKIDGVIKPQSENGPQSEQVFSCQFYPNPTTGILNIKVDGNVKELFLTDLYGRVLERFVVDGRPQFEVDISPYPSGTYQVTYFGHSGHPLSGRIVLAR